MHACAHQNIIPQMTLPLHTSPYIYTKLTLQSRYITGSSYSVGFSTDLDCFHCSPLPEASCCPMNPCSLSVDAVVGGVGVHGYPVLLISLLHCLLVFTYSGLQWSLGLSNVHLGAVLARSLVDHFLPLLFSHLRCTLTSCCFNVLWGLKTGFTPSGPQVCSIFSLRPLT